MTRYLTAVMLLGLVLGCGREDTGEVASSQPLMSRPAFEVALSGELEEVVADLYSESAEERAYAATRLGRLGSDAEPAVPFLVDRLEDADWRVRRQAAEGLGAVGDVAAVDGLIEVVGDRNGEWAVRTAAARSLGQLGDPRAVAPLVAVLNDMNAHVRHMAVIALGQIGTPETVEPLTAAARSDSDGATRFSATEALERLEASAEGEIP